MVIYIYPCAEMIGKKHLYLHKRRIQNEKKALEENLSDTSGDADDSDAVSVTVHSQREGILG